MRRLQNLEGEYHQLCSNKVHEFIMSSTSKKIWHKLTSKQDSSIIALKWWNKTGWLYLYFLIYSNLNRMSIITENKMKTSPLLHRVQWNHLDYIIQHMLFIKHWVFDLKGFDLFIYFFQNNSEAQEVQAVLAGHGLLTKLRQLQNWGPLINTGSCLLFWCAWRGCLVPWWDTWS